MKKTKRQTPKFRISFDLPVKRETEFRTVLPFKKFWFVISVIMIIDIVFLIPAIGAFNEASHSWANLESLMDLTFAIFSSVWLLGWSIAPFLMSIVIVFMLFGREVIRAGKGWVEIGIGLPGIILFVSYDPVKINNLRLVTPEEKSGTSWRGRHISFNHNGDQIDFGSSINEEQLSTIKSKLQQITGEDFHIQKTSPAAAKHEQDIEPQPKTPLKTVSPETPNKKPAPKSLYSFSVLLLILVNLIPIAGFWLWGWHLSDVMVLYWAESAVIGFFNICKIALINKWLVLLTGPFFLGHFSAFMAVHFLFIYNLFIQGFDSTEAGDNLLEVAQTFTALWPALLGLFLSHAFSFFRNFVGDKEYLGRSVKKQMMEPYNRIMFMHLVLIFGGGLAMFLGDSGPVIILVIMLKIVMDVRAHLNQHR